MPAWLGVMGIAIAFQRLLHFAFSFAVYVLYNSRVIACNVTSDLAYGFALQTTTRPGLVVVIDRKKK
jgi:hypothetical protein